MTRKEFLALSATGLATVAGLDRFSGLLGHGASPTGKPSDGDRGGSASGFGSGAYGR